MTLTTELSQDFYDAQIKTLQGERDHFEVEAGRLKMEFDAALAHIEWLNGELKKAEADKENALNELRVARNIVERQRKALARGIA